MKREQQTQKTREQLTRTAARLFAEHGYKGVSLDAIARGAGVNKALVSYHFGGKRGLYSAVIQEVLEKTKPGLDRVRTSRGTPRERLGEFVDMMADLLHRYPHFPFILLREEMSGGMNIEKGLMDRFLEFFRVDREILEEGMEKGDFRSMDPHAAHLTLIGALIFFFVTRPLRETWTERVDLSNPELEAYTNHLKRVLLEGFSLD